MARGNSRERFFGGWNRSGFVDSLPEILSVGLVYPPLDREAEDGRENGRPKNDADAVFSMMPKGLTAAVLATLPAAMLAGAPSGIWESAPAHWKLDELFVNAVLIVVLGTTILATILSFAVERRIDKANREDLRKRVNKS